MVARWSRETNVTQIFTFTKFLFRRDSPALNITEEAANKTHSPVDNGTDSFSASITGICNCPECKVLEPITSEEVLEAFRIIRHPKIHENVIEDDVKQLLEVEVWLKI